MVHRTQKNTLLSIVGLLQRLYITQWKSCIGQGMGKGCGASMHSLGMPPSSIQLSEPYRSGGFHRGFITYEGGYTKKTELIYKKCVFILTCLNFSHLQSTLHLMQYTYWDFFSTAQNSFWTHQFWCLLVLLPFFVSPIPHWQNISLWGLFSTWRK